MFKNLAATLLAACLLLVSSTAPAQKRSIPVQPVKAAWVYMSPVTEAGWTRQHEIARQQVQARLGHSVRTRFVASVPEGPDAERVLRDLAMQGHQIIFTTSFGYMEPAMKVARDFPQVKFEVLTGLKRAPNVATANARHYEGRYLSGIVAGRMTKSRTIGYVAGFPLPEVLQGINAFALGLRSVNPQARVHVIWLNEWFNPARERDAAMLLMSQGADVLAFHAASTAVAIAAEERGKYVVAYHSDMRRFAPSAQIVAVTHHWGDYATARIRALQAGQWRSQDVWLGLKQGAVRVEGFGRNVPSAVQKEVRTRQAEIAAGRLHPFTGPLRSQDGRLILPAGKTLSDPQILRMNWLLQGVQAAPFRR